MRTLLIVILALVVTPASGQAQHLVTRAIRIQTPAEPGTVGASVAAAIGLGAVGFFGGALLAFGGGDEAVRILVSAGIGESLGLALGAHLGNRMRGYYLADLERRWQSAHWRWASATRRTRRPYSCWGRRVRSSWRSRSSERVALPAYGVRHLACRLHPTGGAECCWEQPSGSDSATAVRAAWSSTMTARRTLSAVLRHRRAAIRLSSQDQRSRVDQGEGWRRSPRSPLVPPAR